MNSDSHSGNHNAVRVLPTRQKDYGSCCPNKLISIWLRKGEQWPCTLTPRKPSPAHFWAVAEEGAVAWGSERGGSSHSGRPAHSSFLGGDLDSLHPTRRQLFTEHLRPPTFVSSLVLRMGISWSSFYPEIFYSSK